jgi:CheY-like chemotaxis protein
VDHLEIDRVEHYLHVTDKRNKRRRMILLDAARPVRAYVAQTGIQNDAEGPLFRQRTPDGIVLEAVQIAEEFKPDVALLDIMMPRMDGVSAARLIRQQVPGCRVFAVSATRVEHPDLFEAFLLKPCNPERLRSLLAE